ncbi:ATP-binding cassette sub-family B member 10, mitochondrial isoform X2 [Rhinoraja longicauda]
MAGRILQLRLPLCSPGLLARTLTLTLGPGGRDHGNRGLAQPPPRRCLCLSAGSPPPVAGDRPPLAHGADPGPVQQQRGETERNQAGAGAADVRRLLALAYPQRWPLAAAVGFLGISSMVTMSAPFFLGRVIDTIYTNPAGGDVTGNLTSLCAVLSGIFLCGAAANGARVYLMLISGQQIVRRLRGRLFSSILCQEVGFFDKTSTGELINRLSSDAVVLGNSVTENLSDGLRAVGQASAGIGMMFWVSPQLAMFVLGIVPPVATLAVFYGRYLRKLSGVTQDSLADATQFAEERIGNIRTVRVFAKENSELQLYMNKISHVLQLAKKEAVARAGFYWATGLTGNMIVLTVLYKGGLMMGEAHMTVGGLTSFMMYAFWVGISIGGLGSFYSVLMKGLGAGSRLWELLERKPAMPLNEGIVLLPEEFKGAIEFRGVQFAYPTRQEFSVFSGLDLSIPAGSVMAVVGSSGSGKSTLVSLLLRLYDPALGTITVDGHNIRSLNPHWLRENIGVVNQEPILFSCSIAENIAYGATKDGDLMMRDIEKVAKVANAFEFIRTFPKGFQTMVGEKGVLLSEPQNSIVG